MGTKAFFSMIKCREKGFVFIWPKLNMGSVSIQLLFSLIYVSLPLG